MGLDMYLRAETTLYKAYQGSSPNAQEADKKRKQIYKLIGMEESDDLADITVKFEIGYWRKANAIHNFFVEQVQGSNDNCETYYVPDDKIKELKHRCETVLADISKAEELLPTQGGFFFGDTDYTLEGF